MCTCTRAHASSLPVSTMARRVGGHAPQHCNEINDPWFFRCDQETKLSSRCETKGVTGGKTEKFSELIARVKGLMPGRNPQGSADTHQSLLHPRCNVSSDPHHFLNILLSHFLPETFCQSAQTLTSVPKRSPPSGGFTCKESSFIG